MLDCIILLVDGIIKPCENNRPLFDFFGDKMSKSHKTMLSIETKLNQTYETRQQLVKGQVEGMLHWWLLKYIAQVFPCFPLVLLTCSIQNTTRCYCNGVWMVPIHQNNHIHKTIKFWEIKKIFLNIHVYSMSNIKKLDGPRWCVSV